jgi:hypothetical protein
MAPGGIRSLSTRFAGFGEVFKHGKTVLVKYAANAYFSQIEFRPNDLALLQHALTDDLLTKSRDNRPR